MLKPFFDSVMFWVDKQYKYHKAANELYNLTNRELADLGLSRSEIPYIVMQTLNKRS